MAEGPAPISDALQQLERGRRDRWSIGALLLVSAVAALVLLLTDVGAVEGAASWVVVGFLGVTALFGISVAREERRARRTIRALVAERERAVALAARAEALETMHAAARDVTAVEDLVEVFARLLVAARELTDADVGAVLLRTGDVLTVAAADGPGAPVRGTQVPRGDGPAWAAVTGGTAVQAGRGAAWGGARGSSTVAAPLALPDRIVGALVVERGPDRPAFTPVDRLAVSLFAEHAALAVRNATRLDEERHAVSTLQAAAAERAAAVAGYSHDLRTPLSAISGYAQLLRERDDRFTADRRRAVLSDILHEVERLRGLVDGLVRAASVEAGVSIHAQPVDLAIVAHEAAQTARGAVHAQRAPRQVDVHGRGPIPVRGDPQALRRVVANLLDNAITHSPPGSPIEVRVSVEDGEGRLSVRDHGPGIEPDELEAMLEPFARGRAGGTGLGLHVVRTLVDAHGGRIQLSNARDGGLEACILLPLASSPDG